MVLDLAHRQAQGLENFLVSRSNAAAVELVDRWPDWVHPASFLSGPAGAGKSHLAHVWAERSQAAVLGAATATDATIALLETRRALVLEDIDRGVLDERVLFHLLNLTREKGLNLLLTSRLPAGDVDIGLPDLRSRLRALPMVTIETPDELLLKAVLVKLFSDRQLDVEPHVVAYLSLHMERSMQAANAVVAEADRLALAKHRKVSRSVAAQALANVGRVGEGD